MNREGGIDKARERERGSEIERIKEKQIELNDTIFPKIDWSYFVQF